MADDMGEDLMHLMMPLFSDIDNDEFGTGHKLPPVISMADAMEGRPITTESPLFILLPREILHIIVSMLDREALATLAQLNSDCRQLARTYQFRSWSCDYRNLRLFAKLQAEAEERANYGGRTQQSALGACIRVVEVATDPEVFAQRYNMNMDQTQPPEEDVVKFRSRSCLDFHHGIYHGALKGVLRGGLPNLERLIWLDKDRMQPQLLHAVLSSPVRYLKLFRILVDESVINGLLRAKDSVSPRLEVLALEPMRPLRAGTHPGVTHNFVGAILQRCVSTLRELSWNALLADSEQSTEQPVVQSPPMTNLRRLILQGVDLHEYEARTLILPSEATKLTHLSVMFSKGAVMKHLEEYGEMPSLKSLTWDCPEESEKAITCFLSANPQLQQIACCRVSELFRDDILLPTISSTHRKLVSLQIECAGEVTSLSNEALHAISKIRTLQQLHLSAGCQFGWRHNWAVDHDAIRHCVSRLPNLRILALSRDTYDPDDEGKTVDPEIPHHYYSYQDVRGPLDPTMKRLKIWCARRIVEQRRELARQLEEEGQEHGREGRSMDAWFFEMVHRRRMLIEANKYVDLRYAEDGTGPKLEMMYFGQLPMQVVESGRKKKLVAMAMTEERDECFTWLENTFRGAKMGLETE